MQNTQNEVSTVTAAAAAQKDQAPKFNLRLNQPDFWNTPNPTMEEKLLAHWKATGLATKMAAAREGAETFWLLDGPPYANGEAHLGHLLNKTLKDVNARFQSSTGKNVVWRAGWDCHGLPLELAAEKRHGPGSKDDPLSFMGACRAEAKTWQMAQATGMERLGLVANFDQPWLTMDPQRESASLGMLKALWESGLLVERHSPVHWCPACQSALAASELEKTEKARTETFFLAALTPASTASLNAAAGVDHEQLYVMSWTTTPWTLWANAAFAHPETGPATLVTLVSGKVALMAVAARDAFAENHSDLVADDGRQYDGKLQFEQFAALGLAARSPLSGRVAPLVPASFATANEGSGFVHVAPAFGPEDFDLHETAGVRLECHVAANGRLVSTDAAHPLPAALEGLTLELATDVSCELLKAADLYVHSVVKTVEAQMCWRHKKATFYRASSQWALDLHAPFEVCPEGLAARATAALEATTFLPDNRAKTPLAVMLATRRFWTLSRDRLWGLPLPFFRHEVTNALHPDTGSMWSDLVEQVRDAGVEAWQSFPTPEGYRKTTQTVDVWFDSGAAWHSASENGRHQPDMGVEGQDQTRGWFLSSFLLHAFKSAEPAFKTLMTHSFVVGEDGLKLSKSKGGAGGANAMAPAAVFAKEGADAFRLWVCAQNVGDEARWGKTALKQASQDLKDWRSFLRFLLANMAQGVNTPVPADELTPLDQLARVKAAQARDEWLANMQSGRFNQAMQALNGFRLWASTDWFEMAKRTLYCAKDDNVKLTSMQWTLQEVFTMFVRMLAVALPFAAEEAYLAWPAHPDTSVFVGVVPMWSACDNAQTQFAKEALVWRRALLPLVERARGLLEKGTPVALGFKGATPFGFDENDLREWFPNTYPRLDGATADFEQSVEDEKLDVVAGRAAPAYAPHRCARCRGYFKSSFATSGMCLECESEV